MRISHEAIYQALYIAEPRGAQARAGRVPAHGTGAACSPGPRPASRAWAHVTPEVMISERPAEADDRAVPGHWEGDLLIGLERSAIGTLVERTTRFHDADPPAPRRRATARAPRTKNGPALAGYGAVTMKNALAATMTTLPEQLRRSLTWDRGKELVRSTPSSRSRPASRSTSPTRRAPGSAARTRTPTACSASTSPKAPTSHAGAPTTSNRSRPRSTADPARHSAGRRRPKHSTSIYNQVNKPVLRRPVELGLRAAVGMDSPPVGWRRVTAIPSASTTSSVLRSSRIDQPTMRRL